MKLSKRYLLLPLLFAAFAYLFYTAYKDVRNRTLSEFNNQQFILARQASRGIESFFIYYQRELTFLSELDYISNLNDQGKKLLADFYNNHSDQIKAITIVDSHGVLQYTYPFSNVAEGTDLSSQSHIKAILDTHKPIVSDVFTSVQGFRTIAFHVPVMSGNEYKGSIAILIPIDYLGKRFVENIKTSKSGYGWLMSEVGVELFNPTSDQTGKTVDETYKESPSVLQMLKTAMVNKEGTDICTVNNIKTLSAFYRVSLGNTFWTIVIFTPESEVFDKLTSFRNRLYLLILLSIIVFGVYFYLSVKANDILKEEKKRKIIEKTLIESEKRFRVMFELSPAGIILLDENGIIIEANSRFSETLGYTRKEVTGKNIRSFAYTKKEGEIENNMSKILSGNTLIHEVKNVRKDGTICDIALYETMIILPDGKPGILSVSNDITEKKLSGERMLTLSRALESIGECVSITDCNNSIIFVNNAFCRTYGYCMDEIIGKNIAILRAQSGNDPKVDMILTETYKGGWHGEVINVRKDGSQFPVQLSTSHIKDEYGNPVALIGIAVDISDRKLFQMELIKAKEKAEESDRLKSAFLANMSHELRTPLNAIIGFSEMIIESGPNQNTLPFSKIIQSSGQHLLSMVEDIFDSTMIETGQLKMNYEKTDIIPLLREVKEMMTGESKVENKNGVDLCLNLEGNGPHAWLITDNRKLKQVLINLLRNALKFTDKGYIEFGFSTINESGNEFYQFYVKDTGIGIDKSYHDAIFNIFRQIDDTHTRKFGGMGIGLSIAKKTVELMGGKIWVDSEYSKGSVFYFTVPIANEDLIEVRQPDSKNIIMPKSYHGKTVLIAEDERSNFDFLSILLTRMDINVLWAKDGNEAVSICTDDPTVDLVLMDIKMPLLNGLDATRTMKITRPDLPVIAQSAYAMNSDKQEAEDAGCDGYLTKPIMITDINELLEKYFGSVNLVSN